MFLVYTCSFMGAELTDVSADLIETQIICFYCQQAGRMREMRDVVRGHAGM